MAVALKLRTCKHPKQSNFMEAGNINMDEKRKPAEIPTDVDIQANLFRCPEIGYHQPQFEPVKFVVETQHEAFSDEYDGEALPRVDQSG